MKDQLRAGDWMQTYTGRQFWPLDPCAADVCIEDIAHALSNQCRFAGHCERFYSVAEHSIRVGWLMRQYVADEFRNRAALAGLLHDAAEAYLVDLPRPIKRTVSGYKDAEDRVMAAIIERFSVLDAFENYGETIKHCDNVMLATEAEFIMKEPPAAWHPMPPPLNDFVACWSPVVAEKMFLELFAEWSAEGANVDG